MCWRNGSCSSSYSIRTQGALLESGPPSITAHRRCRPTAEARIRHTQVPPGHPCRRTEPFEVSWNRAGNMPLRYPAASSENHGRRNCIIRQSRIVVAANRKGPDEGFWIRKKEQPTISIMPARAVAPLTCIRKMCGNITKKTNAGQVDLEPGHAELNSNQKSALAKCGGLACGNLSLAIPGQPQERAAWVKNRPCISSSPSVASISASRSAGRCRGRSL